MYKNGIYGAVIGDICGSKMEVDEFGFPIDDNEPFFD